MRRPQNLPPKKILEWFKENKVKFEDESLDTQCWIWKGSLNTKQRPIDYWKGKNMLAYHITYMCHHDISFNNSPFSQSVHASHLCNNPSCVNPEHIQPMTASENENMKKSLPGWNAYIKQQKAYQLAKKVKMPTGLSHKQKAEWILENNTIEGPYNEKLRSHCRDWSAGCQDAKGYARRSITIRPGQRKKVEMHRYIHCMLNNLPYGEDPNDEWNAKGAGFKVANHICERPCCVNPEHIELISRSQNALKVTNSKSKKLTENQVRLVIEDFLKKDFSKLGSKKQFAEEWAEKLGGYSIDIVYNIVFRKRNWKYLLEEYNII